MSSDKGSNPWSRRWFGAPAAGLAVGALVANLVLWAEPTTSTPHLASAPRLLQGAGAAGPRPVHADVAATSIGATTTNLVSSANPTGLGQSVTFTATVTPAATGTVTFMDGATTVGSGSLASSVTTFATTALSLGSHSMTAVYGGDSSNSGSTSAVLTQVVNQATTTGVTSSVNPLSVGQPVTYTATVTPSTGTATGVPSYDHIFFVIDENHARSQVIGPAPYLTSLADANAQSSAYYAVTHPSVNNYLALFSGQIYTPITDSCTVGSGSCHTWARNVADEVLASGRTVRGYMESMPSACYVPHNAGPYTERHNPLPYFDQIRSTSRCADEDVPYTQLATDLSSASTTPNFVWVTPNRQNDMHDRSVAFGDAWAQSNFPAIFNSPAWTTQHSLFIFTFDEDNRAAGNNVAFFVLSSDGTTKKNFTSTVPATHYSALRTIEAAWGLGQMTANDAAAQPMSDLFTLPPTATGAVTFMDGSTTLGTGSLSAGSATFTTNGLNLGSHSITAVYGGDSNYGVSTSTAITQAVNQATTTGVVAAPNPSSLGQSVTFTATVTPASATGTVTFIDGSTALGTGTLNAGSATATTTGLILGNHSITAVYEGDTNYGVSTSTPISEDVNQGTTTALVSSVNPSTVGQSVTFTATVTPSSATGKVTFMDGAKVLGVVRLSSGTATFTTSRLSLGTHTITAVYKGASGFSPSTSPPLNQTVQVGPVIWTLKARRAASIARVIAGTGSSSMAP